MLFQVSEASERRTLTTVGAAMALCAVAVWGLLSVANPFSGRAGDRLSVAIHTPYVGQGVAKGTAVVLHGVKVGEVTAISSLPQGGVRVDTDLQKGPTAGLTDALGIDFQPINYFGVSGINLIAGQGGHPLLDGTQINIEPKGNFTLQALLSRLGSLSTGALTTRLIEVVDKATRYTDALDPLTETLLIAANAVADTQTVRTAQLLTNATGLSVAFPSFVNALTDVGAASVNGTNYANYGTWNVDDDTFKRVFVPYMDEASVGLFGAFGRLERTHVGDLLPLIGSVKLLTDVVPPLIRPEGIAETLVELRSRLEKMYVGTPEQRALQVRIILDSLPGVAAPLAAVGGGR
ncbi:MlaD family protein [Mycobacterium branderi]|uniref:Mammalian cell entry related domain protein n=1 Tax=Mycobacterium branderi TaxID=43348 RepID=UPI001E447F91|nr:Mammalian cell entry related domain protein [Mycobacterium branderi]